MADVNEIRERWAWINRCEEAAADGILWNDDEAMDALVQNAQDDIATLLAEIDRLAARAQPTLFDPDDRDTWPGEGVKVWVRRNADQAESLARLRYDRPSPGAPDVPHWWWQDAIGDTGWEPAETGDLWLPLPPTPEVQG